MVVCKNRGCGKEFLADKNVENSCRYHPSGPVFHEGLKGWGCCSKRVSDFEEFMKIEGCTTGMHSEMENEESKGRNSVAENSAEEASTATGNSLNTRNGPQESYVPVTKSAYIQKTEDLNEDPAEYIPKQGDICKRSGCGAKYGESSDQCSYHPGQPIFHEGSKGWTCCTRKVLEFDEFLKIKGCKSGKHRYLDLENSFCSLKMAETPCVDLRLDWYQTQSTVTLDIYAKNTKQDMVSIDFGCDSVTVNIHFPDGRQGRLHKNLFQPIIPSACSYRLLSTKIELSLKKANGYSWPSLEPSETISSWTTFGTNGGGGTVGAKEAVIAGDAPLYVLTNKN